MSKQIRFVPPIQNTEIAIYSLHFEKIVSSLYSGQKTSFKHMHWLVLQEKFILHCFVDWSSIYEVMKGAIQNIYK